KMEERYMATLSSTSTTDLREYRRLRAWELHQHGWPQHQIVRALGVSKGAVSQWLSRARKEGVEALQKRSSPRAPARLTNEQKAQLAALLAKGAEHYGFRGDVWLRARIQSVIKQTFGVTYSVSHISWLMQQIGWSRQKPRRRARQRSEQAVEQWLEKRWPELK